MNSLKHSVEFMCSGHFYASFMPERHNVKVELNCLQDFHYYVIFDVMKSTITNNGESQLEVC